MKSCSLKGQQKVFYLQNTQAASCCRAYPISLNSVNSVRELEEIWESERSLLEQGVELPGCKICWDDEQNGIESFRLRSKRSKNLKTLELYIDNTCNQMCSYCSPKFSSTWQQSIEQNGVFRNVSSVTQQNMQLVEKSDSLLWVDKVTDYINQCDDNSVELMLLGGEPLMQIRNLQKLATINSNKISTLKITTNLNPPNPKFLSWALENFPADKLQISISLDATPEYNYVPRGHFDSLEFNKNIELLENYGVKYNFLSVISVLSLFDLHRFVKWINGRKTHFSTVTNPDCLNPMYLPPFIKRQILSNISEFNLPKFVTDGLVNEDLSVDLKLFEQYNYLKQYFQRVNINPALVDNVLFLEHWSWLEEKFK